MGWGLNAVNWYQLFVPDSVIVETQQLFSLHRGFLTYAMYHHRELIKLTHYDKQGKGLTRAKYNLELMHGGPS